LAIKNSFIIGFFAAIIATSLGTLAAVGLSSRHMPFKRYIMALMLSPMIVPDHHCCQHVFFYTKFIRG
jgi:putative spermidine/putrescine transport system permease protein